MVKNISITEDVYNMLVRNKLRSESFSKALVRILSKKKNILEFAGVWADMDEKEASELKENISNLRKEFNKDLMKRVKRYDLH